MQSIISSPKIHFYEFMQIQILHEYIQTGIEYMIKSLINSNNKFINLRYWSKEISTIISAIKDIYCLIKHKSIYAEKFYGLQRTNQRNKIIIILEIILWTLIPYIFRKLQQKFISLKQQKSINIKLNIFSQIYIKIFPYLFAISKIVPIIMKFKYLMDSETKYYNPQYLIAKTELSYAQQEQPSPYPIMALLKSPGLFLILIAHKIASFIFSSQNKKTQNKQIPQVQPPITQKKQKSCPICGNKWKNPSVLKTSGYVFCYSCINEQIRKNKKCPITNFESDETQIQIIYE